MSFKQAILFKKAALTELLEGPMTQLAGVCAEVWGDADALDRVLADWLPRIPHCHLLYALNTEGVQISSNVLPGAVEPRWRGQTLAERPYHSGNLPYRGFLLSSVYVSTVSHKRCITAMQAVNGEAGLLGFLAADFNLEDIPLLDQTPEPQVAWTQYKGDPSIRGAVFQQTRMSSRLDERIDEVIGTIDTLMREHGIYHFILHFSSSRAIFWVYDDPYRYRFHSVEEMLDPEIWLVYPSHGYPTQAKVQPQQIRPVLEKFRELREADENIYLRSGSLNIMNGVVGLTFSCDGSHYISVDEFLDQEHPFTL